MTRVCAHCGGRNLSVVEVFAGYWRKECLDCGSTGPFEVEEPTAYGPGNGDWERDVERDSRASKREDVEARKGTG